MVFEEESLREYPSGMELVTLSFVICNIPPERHKYTKFFLAKKVNIHEQGLSELLFKEQLLYSSPDTFDSPHGVPFPLYIAIYCFLN